MAASIAEPQSDIAGQADTQARLSSASEPHGASADSASLLSVPLDNKALERMSIAGMDSSSDSTSEGQFHSSKRKFWSRVRKSRERRSTRCSRDSNGAIGLLGFDICNRRTTRNIFRFSCLAAACAFTSIITLWFSSMSTYSAFDMAFGAFAHPDGYPLDVHSPVYPATFLRSVMPIPCHSHNDQWRHTPLHAALGTGCISVEADVWASPDPNSDTIFVGHDRGVLLPDKTLQAMYIEPLMNILSLHNADLLSDHAQSESGRQAGAAADSTTRYRGVFTTSPSTSLILLLDFKSSSEELFHSAQTAIQPLIDRDWISYWDEDSQRRMERPVTVVASGDVSFDMILRGGNGSTNAPQNITRYIFYDAPLHELVQPGDPDALPAKAAINIDLEHVAHRDASGTAQPNTRASQLYRYRYNPSNSHLASTSLGKAVGAISPLLSHPDSAQRRVIREQIRAARNRGLISRYWGTPRWPRGLRDNVWESLETEGVGLLNVDDLRGVRKGEWGRAAGGRFWGRKRGENMGWLPEPEQ